MLLNCFNPFESRKVGENRLVFVEGPKKGPVADLEHLRRGYPYISESQHGKTREELKELKKDAEAERARLKEEAEANKEKLADLLITLKEQVGKKEWKKVRKTAQEILEIDPKNEVALAALSQAEAAELAKLTKKPKKGPVGVKVALERTKRRIERQLFGKEELKAYVETVSESIEKMNPDLLHKFIEEHKIYDNYRAWNKELCEILGFKGEKGADLSAGEQMKYVAALQIYLADHFFQSNKEDIFQARRGKKANPFIYIDGKLGGYTMSVLAEYWNSKYPKKKEKMGALAHSQLSDRLSKRGNMKKTFDYALAHLNKQLGKGPVEVAEGPLVLHEKFDDYFKFYPLLLRQYYTQKEIDGLKMNSDSFKRGFNKIVPVLIKNAATQFKDKEALTKVLEKSGADLSILLPDYKKLEEAVVPPVSQKRAPKRGVKKYPKLSVTPEQLEKAGKKPQTKAMIQQLVGRRTERAKKKIQSGYEGQLDAFSAFNKFDIHDLDSFEGIRKGSKLEAAYKAFLVVANPLMKLKSRSIRNPEAEKEMEAEYNVALKKLEKAARKYYREERAILDKLDQEFTEQIAGVNLVIEAPNIGGRYRDVLGSKAMYEIYHNQLVSNYINGPLKRVAPRFINYEFLSKPYKIAQFLETSLDNNGLRPFTSFEDLSGHFRKGALDRMNQIFPQGVAKINILRVMNELVKMSNLYRLREAGLSRENYEARLREEYAKVDSVKAKASGPLVAGLEKPPR